MDGSPVSKKRQIIATLAVLIVIAVIVGGVAVSQKDSDTDSAAPVSTSEATSTTTSQTSSADTSATYKDGTYTAVGGYNSPGGAEEITVSVTLENGKVVDSTVEKGATGGEAEFHQEDFIGAFKELVIGKDISTLKLSRVAGASLTTGGFNNAITQIKSQAQS